jgi:hypothetical protein
MPTSPLGVRFVFSRDHSFKFQRADSPPVRQPSFSTDQWHVAGTFDLLNIRLINSLQELDVDERSISSYGDLVLFPLREVDADKLASTRLDCSSEHKLMFCLAITLSPAAYEFAPHYNGVFDAINRMAARLQATIDASRFPTTIMFRSLGSPDLVLVALPNDPAELRAAHSLERQARTALLRDIRPVTAFEDDWPGHACSLVEPIIAFQPKSEIFDAPDFHKAEDEVGMALRFAMRVDSGHEVAILADLEANFPSVQIDASAPHGRLLRASAPYTIHGTIRHLSDFIRLLRERWYFPSWRESNLIDTVTVLFFPEDELTDRNGSADYRKAWQLRQEVVVELEAIRAAFSQFGKAFLGQTPYGELMRIFGSFQSCFYRFEYLGVARDLFPFFSQLASAFRSLDVWEEYLRAPLALADGASKRSDRFDDQIADLLSHLSRAIRNRMENRSVHSDLFLATTLEHGGCKLVSAYTVVFWLCSELFRRRLGETAETCDSNHFAACLCAGVEGRVVCRQLFADFRRFAQARGRATGQVVDGRWTAPLMLLEISGASLLRPEMCLVHCMHEVAELSDWICQKRCDELRVGINRWILREVVTAARSLYRESAEPASESAIHTSQELLELLVCCCVVSYCNPEVKLASLKTPEQLIAAIDKILLETHPEQFAGNIIRALVETSYTTILAHSNDVLVAKAYANPVPDFTKQFHNERFIDAVTPLVHLVQELVGDIGMWCALDHLLGLRDHHVRDAAQRFLDLCRIYESLMIAVMESRGPRRSRETIERLILHRWLLQAVAVQTEAGVERVMSEILDYTDQIRCRKPAMTARSEFETWLRGSSQLFLHFAEQDSLVSFLRQFQPYGGIKELGFANLDGFPHSVRDLVSTFYRAWETQGDDPARVTLAMELWAKSERLTFERVLERPPAGPAI